MYAHAVRRHAEVSPVVSIGKLAPAGALHLEAVAGGRKDYYLGAGEAPSRRPDETDTAQPPAAARLRRPMREVTGAPTSPERRSVGWKRTRRPAPLGAKVSYAAPRRRAQDDRERRPREGANAVQVQAQDPTRVQRRHGAVPVTGRGGFCRRGPRRD
jgi:hypothetical protein